jgi:hypothetical protein
MAVYNTKPDFDQSHHTWGTDSEKMITDLSQLAEYIYFPNIAKILYSYN